MEQRARLADRPGVVGSASTYSAKAGRRPAHQLGPGGPVPVSKDSMVADQPYVGAAGAPDAVQAGAAGAGGDRSPGGPVVVDHRPGPDRPDVGRARAPYGLREAAQAGDAAPRGAFPMEQRCTDDPDVVGAAAP